MQTHIVSSDLRREQCLVELSRKSYECFRCRDNGYPNTMIYLAGKDEQGKTIQLEEDGTKHLHKLKDQQLQQLQQQQTQPQPQLQSKQTSEYEQSVERGISAFSMMTDLIRLIEQTQGLLVTLDGKIDRLLNLANERK